MDWGLWLSETTLGCLRFVGLVSLYIFPLMIGMELLKHYHVIEKINRFATPLLRPLGLPPDAVYPLLAGLLVGMLYGGVMMQEAEAGGNLSRRDMFLIFLFLCLCHSVIEDHVLLMAVGAPGLLLLAVRIPLAIGVVWLANKLMKPNPLPVADKR